MHDEAHIPIIRLIPGTGKNKNPIYVMSDLKTPLATFWLPLFKIEFGNDGSIYTAAAIDATEILRGEGTAKDDGQIHFKYSEEVKLPIDLAKKHEYLSFHSSGKIRAHKIGDLGYCPDVANCGNHLECLDCNDLIPDADLESYYLEQADRYLKIAEKQFSIGETINAKDSLHRASLFASLYNKVQNRKDS
ncbi:MAG: hypothetical protein M1300_06945 [Epsilonproteobacteria bacterium]|nr:hypothetical protein [Campylobacterota bacterium]